ncbi:dTMP kinase [Rubneribacter sp.]
MAERADRDPIDGAAGRRTDAPRGIFITFEGGEGAGKTTHIRFLTDALRAHGREVVRLREPGGTDIGERLRAIVLDPRNEAMSDEAELLVYEAARAQIVAEVIAPALARGAVVLCDRFTDSTVAYQAYGRGLPRAFVDAANEFACQGVRPDRTILLETGGAAGKGLARATRRGADRLEQAGEGFHARVNAAFADIARKDPERVRTVRSDGRKSRTAAAVFAQLADLFPWMADIEREDPGFFGRLDARRPRPGRSRAARKGE